MSMSYKGSSPDNATISFVISYMFYTFFVTKNESRGFLKV